MNPGMQSAQQQQITAMFGGVFLIVALIVLVLMIIPLWRIASKAGLPGALSLLILIPGIGFPLALWVIAFMPWKRPVVAVVSAPPYGS